MPTFGVRKPPSIAASFASLLSGSPELSPLDQMQVEQAASTVNQRNALTQKTMAEVQAMRDAELARNDPRKRAEAAAFASGVPLSIAEQLQNHVLGKTVPLNVQNDDEGNALPPATYALPEGLTDAGKKTLFSNFAAQYANQLGTGKTNADELAKAAGQFSENAARDVAANPALSVDQRNQAIAAYQKAPYLPVSPVNEQGQTTNRATGAVTNAIPALLEGHTAAERALASNREAAATLAEARATAAEARAREAGGGGQKPPSGYRWNADRSALEPIPGGPAAGAIAGGAADAGAPHGADYLKTLPSSVADQVKALAEGRMAFPSSFALKTPYWQQMLSAVAQYDPTFDAVNYNARAATRKDFTSGKSAVSINAMNTAIGHLETLSQAADDLKNTRFPVFNKLANFIESNTGDPRVKRFNTAREAIANEVTRVYRGAGGAEADIKAWKEQLDNAGSPEQLHGVIKQVADLLESKISAMGAQYAQGLGTTKEPIQLVTPGARSVLQRLEQKAGGKRSQNVQPEERRVIGGKAYIKVGGDWFEDQRR